MSKQYTTSDGWVIDLRKLRTDDRLYITEHDRSPKELQHFIDQCAEDYFGRDIRKQPLERVITMKTKQCEQQCGADAQCYAGAGGANDWAGHYCLHCALLLKKAGFTVWDVYAHCPECETKLKAEETEGYCASCFDSVVTDYEVLLEQ